MSDAGVADKTVDTRQAVFVVPPRPSFDYCVYRSRPLWSGQLPFLDDNTVSSPSRSLPLSSDDIEVARASSERLASFVKNAGRPLTLRVTGSRGEEVVELPAPAAELLLEILKDMAAGSAVAVLRNDAELTTQQAGDFLNVSRPFLVALLEAGTIPFRKVGTHRRVRFDDLRLYKDSKDDARRTALDELAADAQELGMGY